MICTGIRNTNLEAMLRDFCNRLILLSLTLHPVNALAAPQLGFPLACTLAKDCWIVNYTDVDPNKDVAVDFKCRTRTYENHKGTDFAIADWLIMQQGVDVLAAANGSVLRLRDGSADRLLPAKERLQLLQANKGCGNGVFIDHGGGWQTNYCHLKKGSIQVVKGEKVSAGQKIGEVGHSGYTEFPHLHIGVVFNSQTIDPFTGLSNVDGCNGMGKPLWRVGLSLNYEPVSIYATGFKDGVPDFATIKKDLGSSTTLSPGVPALTFWIAVFGVAQHDHIYMEIRDPRGRIFAQREITQPKDRARQFYFVGKRTRNQKLIKGSYIGSVTLSRDLTNDESIIRKVSRELLVQ